MNLSTNTISAILGIVNLIGVIYIIGWRLGRYELKVDTLWKYVVEAALVDSRQRGVVISNSPLKLNPVIKTQFGKLGSEIKMYYEKERLYTLTDSEIILHLYLRFDKRLIEEVCIPYGLNMGTALIAALHICKGEV